MWYSMKMDRSVHQVALCACVLAPLLVVTACSLICLCPGDATGHGAITRPEPCGICATRAQLGRSPSFRAEAPDCGPAADPNEPSAHRAQVTATARQSAVPVLPDPFTDLFLPSFVIMV